MTGRGSRGAAGIAPKRITRRAAIKEAAVKGAAFLGAVSAGSTLASCSPARRGGVTLRWWSAQNAPAQLAAYRYQIARFEAAHPGIIVQLGQTSDEGYAPQMAAAFISGEVPNVVTHLPSFTVSNYWSEGLLEPFNDVIDAVGPEKYYEGGNRIYETTPGEYAGSGIGNAAANMLWIRRDLMADAGIDAIPETWDELRNACRRMQKGTVYGAPLPYARNGMTSLTIISFIHLAGGQVFSPDLDVALDSDATRNALEFYRSMRELCPPGATNYSWPQSLSAFVSGASATAMYTGRTLSNVTERNPAIADFVTCRTYPRISREVASWTFNGFPSVFIPAAAPHMTETKLLAAWLYDPEGYIRQLHATPGHMLPVLRTIADDPRYQDNTIIDKYRAEVQLMSEAAATGKNLGWESPAHRPNVKADEVISGNLLAEMVQRVVLNDENVSRVIGDTAKKIEAVVSS